MNPAPQSISSRRRRILHARSAQPWANKVAARSGLTAVLVAMGFFTALMLAVLPVAHAQASIQGVVEARNNALSEELVLVDIRRPEEWAETGIADIAIEIDMRSPEFLPRIRQLQQANPGKAIGFICAVGSRSAALARWFTRQGQSHFVDVSAGMIGRNGWLANGLPVRPAPGTHPSRH